MNHLSPPISASASLSTSDHNERPNPVLVEVLRGDLVESRHRGSLVICDRHGQVVLAAGDYQRRVYGRSAIKCLQALPLIESGAADHFALGNRELALACASHGGEPAHVECVTRWLSRIGCSPQDLECGSQPPMHPASAEALTAIGEAPGPLHNNCSGKHAGFLSIARHQGIPTSGYIDESHPVQQQVEAAIAAMCGQDLARAPRGTDGCGIPVIALPLFGIALAMARFADPRELPESRRNACERLRAAIAAEPFMIAGSDRLCSRLIRASQGRALVKTGAEGVYTAIIPETGLGVAVKADDGASRAAEVIISTLLRQMELLPDSDDEELTALTAPPLFNRAGRRIGQLRMVAANFSGPECS